MMRRLVGMRAVIPAAALAAGLVFGLSGCGASRSARTRSIAARISASRAASMLPFSTALVTSRSSSANSASAPG